MSWGSGKKKTRINDEDSYFEPLSKIVTSKHSGASRPSIPASVNPLGPPPAMANLIAAVLVDALFMMLLLSCQFYFL